MFRRVALVIILAGVVSGVCYSNSAGASALTSCESVQVLGVRGSGQEHGKSQELLAIKNRLPQSYTFVEIENTVSGLEGEPRYIATPVVENGWLNDTALRALISRSQMGEYRTSVDSGKNLLNKYLTQARSANTCIALVGYSQGAQVINETVRELFAASPSYLDNVIYIGLLGDPLYNPEGFIPRRKPAWFRGDALYPFYGILYQDVALPGVAKPDYIPRNPHDPTQPFTKIGSWCNYGDLICASNLTHYVAMRDGHGTYGEPDYSESGAAELVDEIRAAVANPNQNITNAIYPSSVCGAKKQDMVLLLDTSAYMRRNADLFTDERNGWDKKSVLVPNGASILLHRTFGEQLFDSGCEDKRVAVVGFEGPSGESPRLLLDFTTKASDVDALMKSLFQPSEGGFAERPQVREAAILAMKQSWRPDASRTLFALTAMAGSGKVTAGWRDTWTSPGVVDGYMGDEVGREFIRLSRKTNAAFISAPSLPIDMTGFTVTNDFPGDMNAHWYLQMMSSLTGGYNWEKTFFTYPIRHTIKNVNFSEEIKQFEVRRDASRVGMSSIKARVGEAVILEVRDSLDLIASAALRRHGTATDWYVDCDSLHKRVDYPTVLNHGGKYVFTPTKPGKCTAAVRVATQGSGAGCYYGCPEIFPPYIFRVIPFTLEILPANYEEKVPAPISEVTKTIYNDRVEVAWQPPAYGGDDMLYLVRDLDYSVLGVTTKTSLTVTETAKQDVDVTIEAIGADGRSAAVSTADEIAVTVDKRDSDDIPVEDSENTPIKPIVGNLSGAGVHQSAPADTGRQPAATGVLPAGDFGQVMGESIAQMGETLEITNDKRHSTKSYKDTDSLPRTDIWKISLLSTLFAAIAGGCVIVMKARR